MPETGDDPTRGRDGSTDDPAVERSAEGPACPFCGSTDTERESAFGSEVSAAQHYCHGCHTVFERIKFDGATADAGRGTERE